MRPAPAWISRLEQWAYPALAAALTLNFAARVYSIVFHRGLFDMGGTLMFNVVTMGVVSPEGHGRYLSILLQLPSLVARFLGASPAVIVRAYEATITWHPVLSLLGCFAILKSRRRLDLLIYPILSFAIADQLSHAFTCGGIHEVISLFWPALLLLLTTEKPKATDFYAIAPFLVALTITQEGASLFLLVLAAREFYVARASRTGFHLSVGTSSCFAAIICVVRSRLSTSHEVADFFLIPRDPLLAIAVLLSLAVAASILFRAKLKPGSPAFAILAIASVLAPLAYFASDAETTVQAARACRSGSTGLSLGFAVLAMFHRRREVARWPMLAAASFLAVASVHDIKITRTWARAVSIATQTMRDSPGCRVATPETVAELTAGGLPQWQLPRISYLLQEDRHPRSVLFPPIVSDLNPCDGFADGREIEPTHVLVALQHLRTSAHEHRGAAGNP
jgi:hypothetical protein